MKNKLNYNSYIIVPFLFILFSLNLNFTHADRQMRILVYPFNNTGNKQFSWVSAGMTDSVVADLGRIAGIMVISNEDRRKAVQEIELGQIGLFDEKTTAQVGKMTGADVIFTGSYSVSGDRVRVIAKLMRVESGAMERSIKLDGTVDGIFDLQDRIVFSLMGESEKIKIASLKLPAITGEEKKLIENKKKPVTSAYELYARGLAVQDSDPKEAMIFFKQAIKIDNNYVDALREAGYTAGNTFNLYKEAFEYLNKADDILKKRGEVNTSAYAALINKIGIVYCIKGDYNIALKFLTKSGTIRDSLGLSKTDDYANLMMHFGIVYRDKGDLNSSLEYYIRSKKMRDSLELRNTLGYAKLMNNIGIVYSEKNDPDNSLEYYNRSKTIRDNLELGKTEGYAKLMYNIGNEHRKKGDFDSAMDYYNRSKKIWESLGLKKTDGYARLLQNIALLYEKQGEKALAGQHYRKAYKIYNSLGLNDAEIVDRKAKELGY